MSQSDSFKQQCYRLLGQVPPGKVTTYREIARALGTRAWRAVGTAMAQNDQLVVIPCHRVVRSDGTIGEYAKGAERKSRLLSGEGVPVERGRVKNLQAYLHVFT